jgi:large subunit ribosomal protein L4e
MDIKQITNETSRRFATASAIAASSSAALLMARGHNVSAIPEVPLVISSTALKIVKTTGAIALLRAVGAGADIDRVKKSRKLRSGKGKLRGRRIRQRRGPLLVHNPEEDPIELGRAFKNIPGVEACSVHALNLLQLAPGGHLGRFVVWTSAAFAALDKIYDTKTNFILPTLSVTQPDLGKLINSSEIQAVLRPTRGTGISKRGFSQKKNPLKNRQVLLRLNPYASAYSKQKLGQEKFKSDKPKPLNADYVTSFHEA